MPVSAVIYLSVPESVSTLASWRSEPCDMRAQVAAPQLDQRGRERSMIAVPQTTGDRAVVGAERVLGRCDGGHDPSALGVAVDRAEHAHDAPVRDEADRGGHGAGHPQGERTEIDRAAQGAMSPAGPRFGVNAR